LNRQNFTVTPTALEEALKSRFEAHASAVFNWDALDVQGAALEPVEILFLSFFSVGNLIHCYCPLVSLVDRSQSEHCEHQEHDHLEPGLVLRHLAVVKVSNIKPIANDAFILNIFFRGTLLFLIHFTRGVTGHQQKHRQTCRHDERDHSQLAGQN